MQNSAAEVPIRSRQLESSGAEGKMAAPISETVPEHDERRRVSEGDD